MQDAHYIAAISRETQDGERRTRLADEAARDLQPMQALKLYLESKGVDAQRQQQVIQRAEQLVEEEASETG